MRAMSRRVDVAADAITARSLMLLLPRRAGHVLPNSAHARSGHEASVSWRGTLLCAFLLALALALPLPCKVALLQGSPAQLMSSPPLVTLEFISIIELQLCVRGQGARPQACRAEQAERAQGRGDGGAGGRPQAGDGGAGCAGSCAGSRAGSRSRSVGPQGCGSCDMRVVASGCCRATPPLKCAFSLHLTLLMTGSQGGGQGGGHREVLQAGGECGEGSLCAAFACSVCQGPAAAVSSALRAQVDAAQAVLTCSFVPAPARSAWSASTTRSASGCCS